MISYSSWPHRRPTNSTVQSDDVLNVAAKGKTHVKMQVATITREHHVTKRVKKVKTKSKGPSVCMMSQERSTVVDLMLTESDVTTSGCTDAEFWARHTETDEDFLK